jgi:NADPH:quinone reductase-like Zn-dependent oxidoreductase
VLYRAVTQIQIGVGAVATQIAREILKLPVVITTASRDETLEFTKKMGATHVINHREKLEPQIAELKLDVPIRWVHSPLNAPISSRIARYIFITSTMDQYMDTVARVASPFGRVCSIVQGQAHMYGTEFMAKSLTFCWELLSTKARYGGTPTHGQRLAELARWVDEGRIQCHMTKRMRLNLKGLQAAHDLVESGKSIGKVGLGVEDEGDGEAFM